MSKFVYSPRYEVDIGGHVFPTSKYRLVYERLLKKGFSKDLFLLPKPATDSDILLVHTKDYLSKLKNGRLSPSEISILELPYSKELVEASYICAGGSILASRIALREGIGIHLGGGFHHAFPDHGEGFCVFNDIAIAIKSIKGDAMIKRALVIDCDLHQGNGTAAIFSKEKDVFTFSIHQENNYPFFKPARAKAPSFAKASEGRSVGRPPSNLDIGLEDAAGDEEYNNSLKDKIPLIIKDFKPEFIMYVAGADPYCQDQLGGLTLTKQGLRTRDEFIYNAAGENKIPVAVVLAGGYAERIEDTVDIHCATAEIFAK